MENTERSRKSKSELISESLVLLRLPTANVSDCHCQVKKISRKEIPRATFVLMFLRWSL